MAVLPAVSAVVDVTAVQERVVFAVGGQDYALAGRGFHRLPHHLFTLDAAAVVREGHAAAFEGVEVYQFLAFPLPGDGAVGEDGDDGVPVNGGLFYGQVLRAVRHRVQVGHGAHYRVAAPGCGQGSGTDGFLPGLARLTEVDMDVTESG